MEDLITPLLIEFFTILFDVIVIKNIKTTDESFSSGLTNSFLIDNMKTLNHLNMVV